ncbi:uncharacterized protein BDCG_16995 [Blastomyces dermatitidis ER-3]|uniref:Uncharacterized protein n=1 Tax=Ajellomyces dermatitidis (strain ER-3 / ATCC MYA-2586) TaxID=559297 RepID=A0ABX2VVR0_AJEDR|nr:uncharacterized protein BDCG_16995 [Blastomyces dermatitidis ER-3]OAT01243.1 hypothetical protein BDCG_16995 [Blastomyces dermatitidis ER-3]
MISYTHTGTDLIPLSEENTTSFSRVCTPLPQQKSEIPEITAHFGMGPSTTLSPPRPLHTYIYYEDREIKVEDSLRYKENTLSEFHSFICILEQKFHLNLSQYNTHEV